MKKIVLISAVVFTLIASSAAAFAAGSAMNTKTPSPTIETQLIQTTSAAASASTKATPTPTAIPTAKPTQKPSATSAAGDSYYGLKSKLYHSLVSTTNANGIVFLGDSITDFAEWDRLLGRTDIINRGIVGDTTEGILSRIKDVTALKPRSVFIMVGINDIGNGVPVKTFVSNYAKIISAIQTTCPKTKIYLQSILPCNSKLMKKSVGNARRTPENIAIFNGEVKKLATQYKCEYLDIYPKLIDKNNDMIAEYTFDGVHPSGAGYLHWKKLIQKYVR